MRRLHGSGSCLLFLLWLMVGPSDTSGLACATARAEATGESRAEEPAGYRPLVEEGLKELELHNFEEARSLFFRAHALYPNARTERAIGMAEFELHYYVDCVTHLMAALRSDVKPLSPDQRAATESLMARANNFVARVRLNVQPPNAEVRFDGSPLTLSAGEPLVVQHGDHTLDVRAPGFVAEKRSLRLQGGEETTLKLTLARLQSLPSRDVQSEERRWIKSPWLWIGVGIVFVGAAGAGYALTREGKPEEASGGSALTVLKGP
jgi:hypothetical protein